MNGGSGISEDDSVGSRQAEPFPADARHAEADAAYAAVGATHLIRPTHDAPAAARVPTFTAATTGTTGAAGAASSAANQLRREGDIWHITYGGTAIALKHSKGVADLAVLLARPGHEIHVTELEGVPPGMLGGGIADALDRRAVDAYKQRLTELAEELDDAQAAHDTGRAELARAEYDVLVDHLTSGVGIGGRARAAGPDPVERLRKAVSARIRDAIHRIETADARLGRHLANAVHTGTYCSYQPEVPTTWRHG